MPGLQVDREGAFALATALVDVTRGVVEYAQHRYDAVGRAVGAADVGTGRADVVHVEPDTAGGLRDLGAVLQRVVDAVDAVVLHHDEEAGRKLRLRRTGVEEGRRGVGEPALAHQVVGLDGGLDVLLVDADGDAHQQVLRTLGDLAVDLQEVGFLQRLEAEEVVAEVAVVDDRRVEHLAVVPDDLEDIIRDQRSRLVGVRVDVLVEVLHRLAERLLRVLVQVADRDARCQQGVIRMAGRQRRGRLGSEVVEFRRGYAVINALDYFLCNEKRIDVFRKAVSQFLDTGSDFVESNRFLAAIALEYVHVCGKGLLVSSFGFRVPGSDSGAENFNPKTY